MINYIKNIFVIAFFVVAFSFTNLFATETGCKPCGSYSFCIKEYHFPVSKRDWKQRQLISGVFNIDAGVDYALAERIKDERARNEITLAISTRDLPSKSLDNFIQSLYPFNEKLGGYIAPSFDGKGNYNVLCFERKGEGDKEHQEILWEYGDKHHKPHKAISYIFIFDEPISGGVIHRGATFTFSSPSDQFDALKPEFEKMFKQVKIEN